VEPKDLEFDCGGDIPPLIPEGKYNVGFLRAEKKWLWGCEKVFLWFEILDVGEFQRAELYLACNAPKKGEKGKLAISNKYIQSWVLAAGKRPDRSDRMTTRVFQDKVFLGQVRAVTTNARKLPRPPLLHYSVIDELLEPLTDSEKE
jgi:hypothetical protein